MLLTLRKLLSNITFPYDIFLSADCGLQWSGGKETPVLCHQKLYGSFWYCFIDFTLAGRIGL